MLLIGVNSYYVSQVKEQQVELEDKVQLTNQLKEQIVLLERRCSLMTAEEEELRGILEQTDRARKMAEHELVEAAERVNLLTTQVHTHIHYKYLQGFTESENYTVV